MDSCQHMRQEWRQFCLSKLEVRKQDLTTVGAALDACDSHYLLAALLDGGFSRHSDQSFPGVRYGAVLKRKVSSTLGVMKALRNQQNLLGRSGIDLPGKTCSCSQGQDTRIVMPYEHFEVLDGCTLLKRHVGATLVDLKNPFAASCRVENNELMLARHASTIGHLQCIMNVADADHGEGSISGDDRLTRHRLVLQQSLDCLSSESWVDSLALRLWLPQSLCDFECYGVLASIFWAMTQRMYGEELRAAHGLEHMTIDFDVSFRDNFSSSEGDIVSKMTDLERLLNYNCQVDLTDAFESLVSLGLVA